MSEAPVLIVALGVGCEILATLLGTAGKQLVSHSARVESAKQARLLKVAGLTITTLLGPIADSVAYSLAPQSIIAPLNGLDIVWNTCSAPYTLDEQLTKRHVIGTLLVTLGASLTSAFGPHSGEANTLEGLRQTFFGWRFMVYSLMFAILLVVSGCLLRRRPKGVGDKARGILLGVTAGAIAGNMFFVAQALGLLRASFTTGDWSAWSDYLPYATFFGAVCVAVSNIPLVTKGLQEYEALFMVTLFEGSHIVIACISGQVVLREMEGETKWRIGLYWMSVAIIVCGLLVVQTKAAGRPGSHLEDDEPLEHFALEDQNEDSAEEASDTSKLAPGSVVVWAGGLSGVGVTSSLVEDDGSLSDSVSESSEMPSKAGHEGAREGPRASRVLCQGALGRVGAAGVRGTRRV